MSTSTVIGPAPGCTTGARGRCRRARGSTVGWRSGGRCRAKSSRFWTIRRVRVASSTSRSASWRRSSGRAGSRRMSWLNPRIEASGLLSSWATPGHELAGRLHLLGLDELGLQALLLGQVADDGRAAAARRRARWRLTSTSCGKRVAVAPDGDRRGPRSDSPSGSAAALARGRPRRRTSARSVDAPADAATPAPPGTVPRRGRRWRRGSCPSVVHDEDRVRDGLEQRPVAALGGDQALAQAEVGERDRGDRRRPGRARSRSRSSSAAGRSK